MNSTSRTAYILQVHKNPKQVNKFIHQLICEDQADVFIHIDRRCYVSMHREIIESPNVMVIPQNINCEWGDISQIETTILLLREVLASKKPYDFVCLRSGQDLLVKEGFEEFLMKNSGKVFMSFKEISQKNLCVMKMYWPKGTRRRYTSVHPYRVYRRILQELFSRGINISPNKNYWPEEYEFYSGSQWFTIPFEAAQYIIEFLDENEWYYQFFENTFTPDEWFFHTLIMNSPFKSRVVNNNLFYFKWGETFSERNSPQFLTSEDIRLIEESNQFFARKFDENIDSEVIDYFASKIKFGCKASPTEGQELSI